MLITSLFNKTITETCKSKGFEEAIVDSKSVKRLKIFLKKYANDDFHLFYFHLSNSTNYFYEFDSYHPDSFVEKNGTIVDKSSVPCLSSGLTTLQIVGITIGILTAVAVCIIITIFVLFRRNKVVSFRAYFLKISINKLIIA